MSTEDKQWASQQLLHKGRAEHKGFSGPRASRLGGKGTLEGNEDTEISQAEAVDSGHFVCFSFREVSI